MMPTKPRVLEFDVSVDRDRAAHSALGGSPIPLEEAWSAEHLVLAALVRCTLTSLDYHLRQARLTASGSGHAHGVVTRREADGLYAFVEIEARYDVALDQLPAPEIVTELVRKPNEVASSATP